MLNKAGRLWTCAVFAALLLIFGNCSPAAAQETATAASESVTAANMLEYLQTQLITIDLKNADLDNVLRLISAQYNVNIVAGQAVEGKVTVTFKDATLQGALNSILLTNGYGYIVDGNIIRVAKTEEIAEEQKQREQNIELEALATEVFFLKYLDATDVKKVIDPILSKRGKATVVIRKGFKGFQFGQIAALGGSGGGGGGSSSGGMTTGTTTGATGGSGGGGGGVGSSPSGGSGIQKSGEGGEKSTIIVVQDIPASVALIKAVIREIDILPKQILISARMFEVNANDLRDLGVQFATGETGLTSTAAPPVTTVPFSRQAAGPPTGADPLIQGGGIARFFEDAGKFGFGREGQNSQQGSIMRLQKLAGAEFDILIKAIESNEDFNELSGPRIMVLENQEAAILVGEEFPIFESVTQADTISGNTQSSLSYFQPIGVSLQVIPQVVGDDQINMVIHPSVSAIAGFVTQEGASAPRISIREADTQVMIGHNETLVIGGLLSDKNKDITVGVPFIMDLPFVGNLAKRKKTEITKLELVIFITPEIVTNNVYDDREKVIWEKTKEKEKVQSPNDFDVIGRKMKSQFLKNQAINTD